MEKIVGNIVSKLTKKRYPVRWDSETREAAISRLPDTWEVVCIHVNSADAALSCTQKFIDSQSDIY